MTRDPAPPRAPRLHAGGKLSFRRRVRPVADDPDLPCVEGGDDPPPLATLVGGAPRAVEIEVGPGKGAFLLAAAAAHPDTFFLGIEASPAYARHAAAQLRKGGLGNARLLIDNARLYLQDRVPEGALARVHVYYPDPWPKRRHRGRRFFTEETPAVLHRCLAAGGLALVATDNPAYAGQIVLLMGSSPLFERDRAEEDRLLASPPGHGFSPTNFERKYIEEGRVLRRYAWRRRADGAVRA
jgi:tRNA (guanine-N7-)-methyltransferase